MKSSVTCPAMLVIGKRDLFLTPKMAKKIHSFIPHCIVKELDATHWIQVEYPDECSNLLIDFFTQTQSKL